MNLPKTPGKIIRSRPHNGTIPPRFKIDGQERPLPSTGQIVINFVGAAARLAKALLTGEKIIRPESEQERIKGICHGCEFYRQSDGRCSKCGCQLDDYIAKTKLETEHCPVGKW